MALLLLHELEQAGCRGRDCSVGRWPFHKPTASVPGNNGVASHRKRDASGELLRASAGSVRLICLDADRCSWRSITNNFRSVTFVKRPRRHAEARRGAPDDRLYIGTRCVGTPAELSGPQLRNAREASARDAARAASTRRGFPTIAIRWEASVRRRWHESSKRSSAPVGAGAPFRGIAQARSTAP